jgi:integrase
VYGVPRAYTSSQRLPASLNAWVLTDDIGVPRYWATVWEALHGGNSSRGTLGQHLLAIERLYISAQNQTGHDCLDTLLSSCNFSELEVLLEGFFVSVQNTAAQSQTDLSRDWRLALDFVRDIIERQYRAKHATECLDTLQTRLLRLDRLYASFHIRRRPKRPIVRALPSSVVENLYELTDPTSKTNPFLSDANKWRNYALFLLYLHQGLRRGEALILASDALISISVLKDSVSGSTFRCIAGTAM